MSQALTVEKRHDAPAFSRHGALALAPGRLTAPAGEAPATTRTRTPLSVVPARPARRKVPFAVFSLLVLAAALASVLMLNISVSGTQYELVQLRNQQTALNQENEALVLAIEAKEAPQNLAAAATRLGMVSSPTFGTVELDSKRVTGTPEPATEGPKPEVLIAAPDLGSNPTGPGTAGDPATDDGAAGTESGTIPAPEQIGSGQ